MLFIILYKFNILYITILYIYMFFMCIISTKYVNTFPIHFIFHVVDSFPVALRVMLNRVIAIAVAAQ